MFSISASPLLSARLSPERLRSCYDLLKDFCIASSFIRIMSSIDLSAADLFLLRLDLPECDDLLYAYERWRATKATGSTFGWWLRDELDLFSC